MDQISNLEVSQLGTRDFQAAVLVALGELMKEQESLRTTLDILARTEEKENLEELEKLISDESSNDEWEISGRINLRTTFIFLIHLICTSRYFCYNAKFA